MEPGLWLCGCRAAAPARSVSAACVRGSARASAAHPVLLHQLRSRNGRQRIERDEVGPGRRVARIHQQVRLGQRRALRQEARNHLSAGRSRSRPTSARLTRRAHLFALRRRQRRSLLRSLLLPPGAGRAACPVLRMRIRLHSGRLGLGIQLACYAQRVLHGAPSAPHLSQQLFAGSGVAMQPLLTLAPKRREHAGARGRPIQRKRAARTGGFHREGASACARDAATTRQSTAHRAGSAFTSPTPLSAERYRSASSGAASLAASLPISAHAAPFARCSAQCAIARGRLRRGGTQTRGATQAWSAPRVQ